MIKTTYLVEEIFQDIPGDPEHVIMTIPPEICEHSGIGPGDDVSIQVKNNQMIITKV